MRKDSLLHYYTYCITAKTKFHYSTKKREHYFIILKGFFSSDIPSEYETSDNDRKLNRNI